jgi:fumarate reductase flavoprotein subunit
MLFGCSSSGSKENAVEPIGNYSGEATESYYGYGGLVFVTITMENGFITEVAISSEHETDGIGQVVISQAPDTIKKRNSPDIDVMTNATHTSTAVIEAARAAIQKIIAAAGG